jgi:lysophospholipase L1-like esterase
MPLTTEEDHDNDKRNAYNQAVRAFAKANGKLLFDIADLEAHDASGRACGYKGGQKLCQCWTDDGGHLDGRGQVQLAKAWYAMAAARAHKATTIPGAGWKLGLLN